MLESGEKERDILSGDAAAGELLAARLAVGPLSPEDALRLGIDIGSALVQVHADGRVHGGLSPYTVAITPAGAQILEPSADRDPRADPYRSPEQVRGLEPDSRSDIFAFGALLYEMASGRPAFSGHGEDLEYAILHRSPPLLMGRSPVHAAMEGVIAGCLAKDSVERRQRIHNAVIELKLAGRSLARALVLSRPDVPQSPPPTAPPQPLPTAARRPAAPSYLVLEAPRRNRWRFAVVVLLVLALAAMATAGAIYLSRRTAPPVLRFVVNPPEHTRFPGTPSISPDGRYLAFSAIDAEGRRMLWLRPLDELRATVIKGSEGGFAPFWSPDSQSLGFFANRSLKKVRIRPGMQGTGAPQVLCPVDSTPGGGAWSADGTILFSPGQAGAVYRISADGGEPRAITTLNASRSERGHLWPQLLPDGRHFLFFVMTDAPETTGMYAGDLNGPGHQFLFASETNAVFSPKSAGNAKEGYLIFVRDRDLVGRAFDVASLAATGEAAVLAVDVGALRSLSLAPISVSRNAILAYQSVAAATRQLVWVDRAGKALGSPSEPGEWGPPRISPDGSRAVVGKLAPDGEHADLWLMAQTGGGVQLTSTSTHEGSPAWSPDGTRVVFFSNRDGGYDIYTQAASPEAKPELLYKSAFPKYPTDWTRDGRYIIFGALSESTKSDVWAVSVAGRRAAPILDTVHSEGYGAVSPDGRWLAYQSDESGTNQVYVQRFDPVASGTQRRWQVSREGGGLPRWRSDGQEIFFMTAGSRLMSAGVRSSGADFQFEEARLLFETRPIPRSWNLYDVSRDGQRFLLNLPLEWSGSTPITVVTNWTEKLNP